MRKEKQDARRRLIEEAAYEILSERGYRSSSMLLIAKKARASNETLYRWYGSKQGLFSALVKQNTHNVKADLEACLKEHVDPMLTLGKFGPAVLELATSQRAIALNRAAAAEAENNDSEENLGHAIAAAGRKTVEPLVEKVFAEAAELGYWSAETAHEACQTYITLLVGDLQVRRVIGVIEPLTPEECEERAQKALSYTLRLFKTNDSKLA